MNPYGKTFVLGLVAVSLSFADPSVIAGERPNVLYILADDIGWGDVGAYHEAQTGTAPVVPTPNLDALARDGMMFTDAHTPAALCAPTRFSLLTGSNPVRNGRPWGTWGLSSSSAFSAGGSHDTLGDVMQRADYRTSFFGKMHFGGNARDANGNVTHDIGSIDFSKPISDGLMAHGFDYSYGMHSGIQNPPYVFYENDIFAPIDPNKPADNSSIREWAPGTYPNPDGTESVILDNSNVRPGDVDWDSSRVGDLLSQKAVSFIDDHLQQNVASGEDKPFFMYYASQGIHVPHTPVNQLDGTPVRGTTFNSKTDMIKELDLQVGRIVQKLEAEGLADDTLIMFTSDNGGLPGSGGGELEAGHDSVGPLRGFKGGPYEGGQRVPFIAKWGDGTAEGSFIQPGTTSEQLVMAQDWAATLYDLTRQNMPANQAQDSTTLLPTLFGRQAENDPLRTFAVMQSRTAAEETRPHMLRMDDGEGEWVLILNRSRVGVQLYNLTTDLGQQTDLINDPNQQARVSAMQSLFRQHDQQNDARGTAAFNVADATLFPTDIVIDVASGSQTQAQAGYASISTATSVTKTGVGTVVFDAANAYTGPTTISAGTLELTNPDGLGFTTVTVDTGATLAVASGTTMKSPAVIVDGGVISGGALAVNSSTGIASLAINAGSIAGSPTVTIADGGQMALVQDARVSVSIGGLSVDQGTGGGRLDVGGGQVTVGAGGITAEDLRADIIAGRNGGAWNGTTGITSSAAAAAGGTRAVGYVVAGDGSARMSFSAPGDTNINGQVDVFDLVAVNSGGKYGTGTAAVWSEGDFNYDGVTNVFDLVSTNSAGAYGQGDYFPAAPTAVGSVAAVPEPATFLSLAVAGLAAGLVVSRRLHWRSLA
jgi:arylsulfatase A